MRPARAYYFLHFAALAALMPYLSIYFASRGLTGFEIGILLSLIPLLTMLGAPFWTAVADATGRHKMVLIAMIGVVLLAALGLSFATHIVTLGLFTALFAFHLAPSMPLLDHAVLEGLGNRAHTYGRQRVWGAFGWALSAPIAGWVTSTFGLPWAFFLFLGILPWVVIAGSRITFATVSAPGTRGVGGGIGLVRRDARWIPFLLTGFVGGVGLAVIGSFLPLHLQELGGSLTVIGVAMAVPAISEIPFMVFGGALLAAIGARRLLLVAVAMMGLRLLLSGVLTDYAAVAAVQLLHGPSFGVFWIAGVSYARELAPREHRAVAQGLFTALTGGLGSFTGSILGGAMYGAWGGAVTFLVAATLMALAALMLAVWWPVAAPPAGGTPPPQPS
jgi:PPP family 3-phenylpropionic acid transporter